MNNKGENIVAAIRYIQTFYSEVVQLFVQLDGLMDEKKWTKARGNRTTIDTSTDITKSEQWLAQGSFRFYKNKKFPHLRKGITICYDHKENNEPLLIIGSISYHDINEAEDWDMRDLWFDDEQKKNLNKDYFDLDGGRINQKFGTKSYLYAMNLVEISTEEDIKEKIFKKLMEE